MKLGLGTYTFRWSIGHKDIVPDVPLTPMDLLEIAHEYGFEVLQYADNMPLTHLSPEALRALSDRARAYGIALELGTESFDVDEVAQTIEIARTINAGILRVALDASDADRPIAELAAEFTALMPAARDAGVRIAIENHFRFPSRRMVELFQSVDDDSLGVCLDVANSICAGEWPEETIGVLAPYAINLHLKDYVLVPHDYGVGLHVTGCPLGEGRLDIDGVFAALGNAPSDMSVILEHWLPRDPDLPRMYEQEIAWMKKHIATARAHLPAS